MCLNIKFPEWLLLNNLVYKVNQNVFSKSFPSLLKGRDSDGFPVFQEKFIRECIRKFPYCDATLLQQLVRSISPVEIVSKPDPRLVKKRNKIYCVKVLPSVLFLQGNDPTALSVLTQAITGQVGFMDADFCIACGEKGAEKRCSICKMVNAL